MGPNGTIEEQLPKKLCLLLFSPIYNSRTEKYEI